ncbi:MAG: Rpp14/Pop5 family protein [Candidatus Thorarchaeota archaeon]
MKKGRRRYLLFKLHQDGSPIDEKLLTMTLWKSLLSLYGEIQAADSKLYMIEYDESSGEGILQCSLPSLQQVIAAAAVIGSINETTVSFEPRKTSGTIKSLKK